MNITIPGLHHVTAVASDPQSNLDFYVGLLGLRLVKRTVNFDDPGTYHFYFGDAQGTPGTIMTFFPWPNARRGRRGTGEVEATAFAISPGSVGYWLERLKKNHVSVERKPARFGEDVIRFNDTDGMPLEFIASPDAAAGEVQPWADGVPGEHALRGFHSVSAALADHAPTARLLTETFGYRLAQEAGNRFRFVAAGGPGLAKTIDLLHTPGSPRAGGGAGSVHHIAFSVADDEQQLEWRNHLTGLGYHVSPVMDRTYFHSIYFREPGSVLFEIATNPPGFTHDESLEELGTHLRLPAQVEGFRQQIQDVLPSITLPKKESFL